MLLYWWLVVNAFVIALTKQENWSIFHNLTKEIEYRSFFFQTKVARSFPMTKWVAFARKFTFENTTEHSNAVGARVQFSTPIKVNCANDADEFNHSEKPFTEKYWDHQKYLHLLLSIRTCGIRRKRGENKDWKVIKVVYRVFCAVTKGVVPICLS